MFLDGSVATDLQEAGIRLFTFYTLYYIIQPHRSIKRQIWLLIQIMKSA